MWAKIEVIPSEAEAVYLPSIPEMNGKQTVTISFGLKSAEASVRFADDLDFADSSFEKPCKLRISGKLMEKLLIPESQIYRIKVSDAGISIGPVIGFLLGIHSHRYNPSHMKKYSDRMGIYNKVGGLIYAFSPRTINWKKNIAYGLYYNITTEEWEYGRFPLPDVIYRRDFHSSPKLIKKLIKLTGGRLFNSYRFSKFELFDFVGKDAELASFLPATELSLTADQIIRFLDSHSKAILKPLDLSRGRGICIIEKKDSVYKVTDYRYRRPVVSVFYDNESLENFFSMNPNLFNRYLVQQYLSLARIGNSIFDIRVVMQKNKDKNWGCTGIECRVSDSSSHLTNISRGGYALSLDEALNKAFGTECGDLEKQVHDLSYKFCVYMDTLGEHFAEFGLDIAVDTDKKLWLIEANVFPSFKGFKKMDRQTYLAIRYTPLLYALSLTQFDE